MENIKFNFLNFYTMYGSKGSVDKPLKREYCFSTIFYQGPDVQNNDYVIKIYKKGYIDNNDNNCLLTTEQLVIHINEIKKLYDFEHTLFEEEECYTLKLQLKAPRMYHKIILSWIRYAYEFPFNVTIYEAFKLKEVRGFKRMHLLNLFNIVSASTNYYKHGTDIHGIGVYKDFKKLITWKEFKTLIDKHIKKDKRGQINSIIPVDNNLDIRFISVPKKYKITNSDYWFDETEFKNRIKVYNYNKKLLKEI